MNLNFIGNIKPSSKRSLLLTATTVSLMSFIVYIGSFSGEFLNYDDKAYLFENPVIKQLDIATILSMISSSHAGWWMPLTWLSFAIDYQLWGLNPFGFHLTNTLIHAANSALVVAIAYMILRLREANGFVSSRLFFAAAAGLIWSLHPLRVESVAWIAERKDVLNGFLSLSAVLFYLRSHRGAESEKPIKADYYISLVLFSLSLLAKSVSVVLPLVLLAIDLYPLKRLSLETFWQRVSEKIPFFVLSAAMFLGTFITAARSNYLVSYEMFPFGQRLVVSGNAIIEYLGLLILPTGLSPLNVIPDPIPLAYTCKAILTLILLVALAFSRRKWLQSCCCCFLLLVLPVLAFFQNGDQAFADHFTYLPAVAPSIAVAAVLWQQFEKLKGRGRGFLIVVLLAALGGYSLLTVRMFTVWRSTESFWSRIVAVQPIAINYKERGRNYHLDGRYREAIADFSAAIELIPESLLPYSYNFYAFRAESLRCAGEYAAAVRDFDTAITALPHPVYFHHRGLALQALGRVDEAQKDFSIGGQLTTPVVWFDRQL